MAEPLTVEAWAPFGWMPVADTDPADGTERLDLRVGRSARERDQPRRRRDRARRRGAAFATGCTATTPTPRFCWPSTAPRCWPWPRPTSIFDTDEGLDTVRAFRLEALEALVLHRGTWHWGPFPSAPSPFCCSTCKGSATPGTTPRRTWRRAACASPWSPWADPPGRSARTRPPVRVQRWRPRDQQAAEGPTANRRGGHGRPLQPARPARRLSPRARTVQISSHGCIYPTR